jgi:AcrR family transcriptional regulator
MARSERAEAAGGKRPKTRTRMRILAACRQLFNERGPTNVTTAEIAGTLGINEGNLYYYFQRKEQILEALFEEFEHSLREVASAYRDYGQDLKRYPDYLAGWFTLMWKWRFFYRDAAAVYRLSPSLRPRLRGLSDDGQNHVREALNGMQAAGLIDIPPQAIDALIVNSWIVSCYWIDYLKSRHGVTEVTREHLKWGAAQVMSLFRPFLTPAWIALTKEARPQEPRDEDLK